MTSTDYVVRRLRRRPLKIVRFALGTIVLVALIASGLAQGYTPVFPDLIQLPANFGPEGIAVGNGATFYVGSLAAATAGQILVGDLRTGSFTQLVAPTGRIAAGMKFDSRSGYLFVAGGTSGRATVYDATSGAEIAFYQFLPPGVPGINDVVVTRDAAYFTDTTRPFLGRVALERNGQPAEGELIPLPANFGVAGPCTVGPAPRGNGIAATPKGDQLILIHMSEGQLYAVDTETHTLVPIAISGGDFAGGFALCSTDGLLLDGQILYAVQFALNRVAVIRMAPDLLSGVITGYITEPFASNPAIAFPTTIAQFGNALYAVTFGAAPPAPDYIVRMRK
jgi:sugar lactone lactonase YvrE